MADVSSAFTVVPGWNHHPGRRLLLLGGLWMQVWQHQPGRGGWFIRPTGQASKQARKEARETARSLKDPKGVIGIFVFLSSGASDGHVRFCCSSVLPSFLFFRCLPRSSPGTDDLQLLQVRRGPGLSDFLEHCKLAKRLLCGRGGLCAADCCWLLRERGGEGSDGE